MTARAEMPVVDVLQVAIQEAHRYVHTKNMFENIKSIPVQREHYYDLIRNVEELIDQGEALAYADKRAREVFAEKFEGYIIPDGLWEDKKRLWTATVLDTLGGVLSASQEHSENFETQTKAVGEALKASNRAEGNLSAHQAGNALTAGVITELVKMRQLMLTQLNAQTVVEAARLNEEAQAEAKARDWAWSPGRRNNIEITPNDDRAISLDRIRVDR